MKTTLLPILLGFTPILFSQSNNNGQLDTITEFTTVQTFYTLLPDGTKLATDLYLPIISDSVTTTINTGDATYVVQIIPKGTQLFVYDSVGTSAATNPYQLPLVFTRTPYGKGDYDKFGIYLNVLGYAYALQDMRGRYESEGVYLPMYSDAWDKSVYHPNETHPLDITPTTDQKNGIYHQDGRHSITYLTDSLYKMFDLDGDGIDETEGLVYNGSLMMFGASALGNTQYQAAASFKNDVNQNGLKGLVPIVATNEHFNCVLQHNGVFRQALVQGWLTGQLLDNVDTIPADTDIQNTTHSIFDYGNISGNEVIDRAIDYITVVKDENGFTGMYPNFAYRTDANASFAPVNSLGESDPNGQFSRYTNLELPMYHLTGWWDIFIDGQLETYNHIMQNTGEHTQQNQKMVIGPWTHATIAQRAVGDIVYPESVSEIKLVNTDVEQVSFTDLVQGDLVDWFRYLMNYEPTKELGEPKIFLPESDIWQDIGTTSIRIPSQNTYISYANFINYLSGFGDIEGVPIELNTDGIITPLVIDLPGDTSLQQPGASPVSNPASNPVDFQKIPNIRFYVPGPVDSLAENAHVGNYWRSANEFPLKTGWKCQPMYLHAGGLLDTIAPTLPEITAEYNHDPDDPIYTTGGGNLAVPTPQQDRVSAGPMNYADTSFAPYTMDREGVIQFESAAVKDSLCIIGVPKALIYASSTPLTGPDGPTDTDFFVRILDVYPDGREYFVVEGAVNARARDYAKQLSVGNEDITIPYSNINSGEVYAFEFNMLPIAYTFGHNHKIKVLISSSNWPRYQSNANIPIEDGDFFRRSPDDGQNYTYNGTVYSPRVARQSVYFSPDYPSHLIFPLFDGVSDPTKNTDPDLGDKNWLVYPNPVSNELYILTAINHAYSCKIYTVSGELVFEGEDYSGKTIIPVSTLRSGVYIVKLATAYGDVYTQKLVKL